MKIGIVTTWYERGAAYVSLAYMEALINSGNHVFIYARGGQPFSKGDPKWDLPNITSGIRYKPLDKAFLNYSEQYINMVHFEKWLQTNSIDIIIFNEEHNVVTVNRVKKLGYFVGAYIDYYKKDTVKDFKVYDFLLCNTKRHYSVFKDFDNALYIPWGTDVNLFKPSLKKNSITSNESPIVFFHSAGWGGVNLRKGTDLLVKAFQNVTGNVKLIIHSQAPLSKYGTIGQMIRQNESIEFLTETVSAPGLYYLGDVFVYPTRLEGIGLSVSEALSCGIPVITTNVPPLSEFVTHNYNGLLVDIAKTRIREDDYYWKESIVNIKSLTKAIQLYVNDEELLIKHKINARASALEKLDWYKNSAVLNEKLHDILINLKRKNRNLNKIEYLLYSSEACLVMFLTILRKVLKTLNSFK